MEEYSSDVLRRTLVEIAGEVAGYMRDIAGSEGLDKILRVGAGGDKTREADRIAEELAIDLIRREHIRARIVTEESGVIDLHSRPEYVVVMDPLDGSMNYVSLIPFAAVSLAIAPMGRPFFKNIVAGAVANIFLKEIYSFAGDKIFVDNTSYIGPGKSMGSIIIYTSNPRLFNILQQFFREVKGFRLRILGSASLELAYIGLGRASIFYHDTGNLRNVDVAAAGAFVERAGLAIVNKNGEPLDFRLDKLYRIDSIVAGEKDTVELFLGYLRRHSYYG